MALDLEKLRKQLQSWANREEVDITTSSSLWDELNALDSFADTIRSDKETLTWVTDKLKRNDFLDENDYFNNVFEYETKRKALIKNSEDYEKRQNAIKNNYNVLANNQIKQWKARWETWLLDESLDIFIDWFTKWVPAAVEIAEWAIWTWQSLVRQTINLPGVLRWEKKAIDFQIELQNDYDEYWDKFYNGVGKVLADNPIWNSFAALLNPVISPTLEFSGQKENVTNVFDTMAWATQSAFKKLWIDIDKTAAAWYNEWLIELLSLWTWAVLFKKFKGGKTDISAMSKLQEQTLLKTDAVLKELGENWNLNNLVNNPLFNEIEAVNTQKHFNDITNKSAAEWVITRDIMDDINNINGLQPINLSRWTATIQETWNSFNRNLWKNTWEISSDTLSPTWLKNLNKAIADWDLSNIWIGVTDAISGKNYSAVKTQTLKSLKENIEKVIEWEADAKIKAIRDYNELVVKNRLDDVELIKNSDISLENLFKKSKDITKQIQELNRVWKLEKLEWSQKLTDFNKLVSKKITEAKKVFTRDYKAWLKIMNIIKEDLSRFVVKSWREAWLNSEEIAILKDKSWLNKAVVSNWKININEIKNKTFDLIQKENINKKISQIEGEIKKIKITTTKAKPSKTIAIKRAAEIDRLTKEVEWLQKIEAPDSVILDRKLELQKLKNEQAAEKWTRWAFLDLTELVELKTISDDFNVLKKTWEWAAKDLDNILDRIVNLKSEANKRNTKRILDKEKAINTDANDILFNDNILTKEAFEKFWKEIKDNWYIAATKKVLWDGKKLVRNLFSTWDRFFIWLTNKWADSTMFKVMRNNINEASDLVTRDFTKAFWDIEKKWSKWNQFDIPKRRQAAKDLTLYAWIKQGLSKDLDDVWITKAERQRIVKDIEWDKTLKSIYDDTISSFKDAFAKLNETSKLEDWFEVEAVKNYFPLVRKWWQNDPSFLMTSKSWKVNLEPYFKQTMPSWFRQARVKNKWKLDVDANFFDIAKRNMYNQYYYAHMKPQTTYARWVFDKISHNFDELDNKQIKHYLDVVETNGQVLMPKNELANEVYNIVNTVSNNFAWAALWGNAWTVIKQLLSEWDIMAVIWPEYWGMWKKHWMQYSLNSKKRAELYEMSPQLAERAWWDLSLKELKSSKNLFDKMVTLGLKPMEWMDTHVAIPAFIGWAIKKWVETWVKFDINDVKTFTKEMTQAGELAVRLSMWSWRVIDVPQVLQNPLTKVFFPFQTNVMTRLWLLFQDAPRKFSQWELAEASWIISAYFVWSALDKIITAARLEARTQQVGELEVLDYILAPERFVTWPSAKSAKEMNETLFWEWWQNLNPVQKVAMLAEQSFYTEVPVLNNIHSTLEYWSPLIWVEWHVINVIKSFQDAYNTEWIVNKWLVIWQSAPWVWSFAKQEVRDRKIQKTLKTDTPYYIKVKPKKDKEWWVKIWN